MVLVVTPELPGDVITWKAAGKGGAVAAGKINSVAAGIQILEKDGNAADAAVATLLALAVTDYGSFAMGGEVPLIIYSAKAQEVKVLCGLGSAPLKKLSAKYSSASRGSATLSALTSSPGLRSSRRSEVAASVCAACARFCVAES